MENYKRALEEALRELGHLEAEQERTELRISHLRKTIAGLRGLCGEPDKEYEELGITDSVRSVLQTKWPRDFTTSEMRATLEEMGMPLGTYKNPLAVIYSVTKRLEAAGEAEPVTRPDGKVGAKWIPKRFPREGKRLLGGPPPDLELPPGLSSKKNLMKNLNLRGKK